MAEEIGHGDVDPDVPESVGLAIMRCPGCGNVHITMLDEDEEPVTEMTLDDDDVLRMVGQLLRAVYPSIDPKTLVDKIKAATGPVH